MFKPDVCCIWQLALNGDDHYDRDVDQDDQDDQDDDKDNDEGRDAAIVESRWSGDEQQGFTRPVHLPAS